MQSLMSPPAWLRRIAVATALGAVALVSAAPAMADHYDEHWRRHHREWRGEREYRPVYPPPVYYAPPRAYYAPPPVVYGPPPGLSITIPFR